MSQKHPLFWLFFSLLFLITPGYAFLHRQGRYIVDEQGRKVFLQGIGLGGWLVPEGYMLHVPGYGSPRRIHERIVDLVGEENAQEFWRRYRQNYVSRQDIDLIAQWGFNHIRLPLHHGLLMDAQGHLLESGFAYLDSLLSWCEANHLYLILDLHCASGGQNKDNISDSDGQIARLWSEPEHQQRTIALWRALAQRYAEKQWIAGYDLLNEPVMPTGMSNRPLRELYIKIVQGIREYDQSHLIFIEGNWYATDFTLLTPPFDDQMIYAFHKYWNPTTVASIQQHLTIRAQYEIPLWLGESGENTNAWFNDCIRLVEAQDIGWCWWTHKKVAKLTNPLSAELPAAYRRIVDFWNGKAARPDTATALNGLFALAEALRLENCRQHPDVLDALLRKDHHLRAMAYRLHELPGILPCAEYDLGAAGVAYFDRHSGRENDAEGNVGGEFRNDDVDICLSQDPFGSPYAVTAIEPGEWLNYQVRFTVSGIYAISARVRGKVSAEAIDLLLDGQTTVKGRGPKGASNWPSWATMSLMHLYIPAGDHSIRLLFNRGVWEINQLLFERLP